MDPQVVMDRVLRIVKLQPDAYIEVAEDESATPAAFVVAILAALLAGIGTSFTNADTGIGSAIVGAIIGAPIGLLIVTAIFHGLAKLFGGSGAYQPLMRALGHGYAPAALGIIPFIGLVGSIWALVCSVVAVREIHKVSTGAAVAVVLIPAAIIFILVFFLVIALVAALSAA